MGAQVAILAQAKEIHWCSCLSNLWCFVISMMISCLLIFLISKSMMPTEGFRADGDVDHLTTEEMNVSYDASKVTVLVTGRLPPSDFVKLIHGSSTPLEMSGDQSAFEALFDNKV